MSRWFRPCPTKTNETKDCGSVFALFLKAYDFPLLHNLHQLLRHLNLFNGTCAIRLYLFFLKPLGRLQPIFGSTNVLQL